MKKNLLPIHILLLFLLFLALWSTSVWNGMDPSLWRLSIQNIALLSLAGFLTRFGIHTFIDLGYVARFEHRLVTTLLLFLLFDSLTPWWVFLVLAIITELAQYFFRSPLGPFFNPAALGAFIVSVFGYLPSWWGVNPVPRISLVGIDVSVIAWITALGVGYVIYRYRKLTVIWSSLLGFALSYIVLFQANPSYFLLEGTLLFFILVMVCEPKTSPVPKQEQFIYGALIGILFSLGLFLHVLEAALLALLLGNLYSGRKFLLKLIADFQKPPELPITPINKLDK